MVSTRLLRQKIRESGLKYKNIAQKLGISAYGLQLKIDNENEFTTSQVAKLCEILEISTLREKEDIFFAKQVD